MKNPVFGFLVIWVTNLIVLLIANLTFSQRIVFGTASIPYPIAILVTSFLLTGLLQLVMPALKQFNIKVGQQLNLALVFLLANIIFLWILKRFATFTGFGVNSIVTVIILAIFLNLVQWGVAKVTGQMPK